MRGPPLPTMFEVRAFISALCLSIFWKKVTGKTLYKKESNPWPLPVSSLVPRQIKEVKDITKMGVRVEALGTKVQFHLSGKERQSPKCKTGGQCLSWEIPWWFWVLCSFFSYAAICILENQRSAVALRKSHSLHAKAWTVLLCQDKRLTWAVGSTPYSEHQRSYSEHHIPTWLSF